VSTDDEQGQEPEPAAAEETGESGGMSERTARAILTLVAMLAAWGLVAAFSEIAYVIVGVIGTLGSQKARRWVVHRRGEPDEDDEDQAEERRETIAETLHRLAAPNVFLADFAEARLMSVESARAVLEALDIRVRRAVRNGDKTGVGVHRHDIPPLPQPLSERPVDPVDQGQPTNQQGVRIERTDGGFIVYDFADTHRHHGVDGH
jgi:hypothetical protein